MDFINLMDYAEDWLELCHAEVAETKALMEQALHESNGFAGLQTESTPDLEEQLKWLVSQANLYNNALHNKDHDCKECLDLRTKVYSSGSKQFVYQCQICGQRRNNALSKKVALEKNGGSEPSKFDGLIESEYVTMRDRISNNLTNINAIKIKVSSIIKGFGRLDDTFFRDELNRKYRQKREQEKKRLADLTSRLDGTLEELESEFGDEKAIQILDEQTIRRKKRRFDEFRESIDRFSSENELKSWLLDNFSRDFYIDGEVRGVHLAEGVNVRIDFVLFPQEHLVAEGFIAEPFGIEVKYFKQESGFTHKTSRGIWQAISYNDCRFTLRNQEFKINFCLLFSNLSFSDELNLVKNFGFGRDNDQAEWNGVLHLANHARVGELKISGKRDKVMGWDIKFAGGSYFNCRLKESGVEHRLLNKNTIEKIRIGNF